jgi:tetratricopeptide (TPR) repeat protein
MDDSRLKKLYQEALEAGRRRDYPQAVRILQEILVHTDRFPEALLLLGRSYHALRDYARAAQVFQLYLNVSPGSAQGHFFLGRSCFALDLTDLAVHHLRRSVELEPSFAPSLGLLGLAVLKSGRPRLAIGFFEQALKLDPQNPRLFNGYLNSLLTQAIRLFSRRRYEESEQLLLTLERHRPDSLVVQLYLAGIDRESGRLQAALAHLDKASRLAPEDPALYLQKAAIRLQRGETQAALLELSQGFRRLGSSAPPVSDPVELARLAMMILFQNRRHRAALEYARRLLRVSYQDLQAHAVMAECFASLREFGKAANHYRRAMELDPRSLELCYGLAGEDPEGPRGPRAVPARPDRGGAPAG